MTIIRRLYRSALVASLLCSSVSLAQIQHGVVASKSTTNHNRALITLRAVTSDTARRSTAALQLPDGTQSESVRVVLNGKEIKKELHGVKCPSGVCLSVDLTKSDGVHDGENVLFVTAKNEDGTASSSRMHFEGEQTAESTRSSNLSPLPRTAAGPQDSVPTLPTLSSFLPPAVAFSTLTPGGGATSANWIEIGTQVQLSTNGCTSIYSIIVLDRQTLAPITSAPESSPQCLNSSGALTQYLQSLSSSSDLVIVGTTAGNITDTLTSTNGAFDTRLIGGREYGCNAAFPCTPTFVQDRPQQYMAIGTPGAEPGSAYENYTTTTNNTMNATATGALVEDASGNYNFQPGPNAEFIVQPGPTASQAYIQINDTPGIPNVSLVYWPPSTSNNASGFWLLVLDRNTLNTVVGCPQNPESNGVIIIPNCGQFFPTGSDGGQPSVIGAMASALSQVTSTQIAILTTIGTAGWGTPGVMASDNNAPNNTIQLGAALQLFGIPDKSILQSGATGSAYTIVGAPGLGGPLSGHNILSSSYLSQQGQTGYVHGTFAPDNHGLFEPSHTQQEPGLNASTGAITDTANLQLGLVLSQQPVEWPIFAAPLFGNGTLAGQIDAYKYISWYLLNNYYFIGQLTQDGLQYAVDPPYAYDIHYFFTGSLNTWIDIHTFDPQNLPFPPNSNGCNSCTWQGPDGTQLNFTVSEFADAQYQLHNEIADLTNVLSLFVTGSTNLKDVVAAGNSNTALALIQASAEVQANLNQQIVLNPAAPVKVNPWHIVNMVANDVSPYVSFATAGAISPGEVTIADKAIGVIGDVFNYAGSIGGGLSSGNQSSSADIPRLDYSLDTTVGQLAGLGLQSQFLAGFDSTLDLITGDWNKLQALGSTAVTNPLYSPTQAAQNTAVNQITTAEQKSLYMSLIPSVFQMHLWSMTSGASTTPDVGYTKNDDSNSCSSFYPGITKPSTGTNPPGVYSSYPTYGGLYFSEPWKNVNNNPNNPFQYSADPPYQDWYVLALPFLNGGHSNTSATVMNTSLANILFANGPGDVNLSLDEFVALSGPMDALLTGAPTTVQVFTDSFASNGGYSPYTNPIGINNGNICSQSEVNDSTVIRSNPLPPNTTVTTLLSPASAVLGDDVTLQATVVVQSTSSAAGGSVQFRDGSTVMQTVALDAKGGAAYTISTLALGAHALSASFASTDGSLPSDSSPQALTVYANSPDMQLSLSRTSLDLSYGTPSSATTLQVQAVSGMSGMVSYACVGLPVGVSCAFQPSKGMLTDGGTVTTSFTLSGTALAISSLAAIQEWRLFLLMVPLVLMSNIRRCRASCSRSSTAVLSLVLITVGGVIGCGGGSKLPPTIKDAGSKTVLISATCGAVTKTVALIVNVQ